jgi:hypothetical protein
VARENGTDGGKDVGLDRPLAKPEEVPGEAIRAWRLAPCWHGFHRGPYLLLSELGLKRTEVHRWHAQGS